MAVCLAFISFYDFRKIVSLKNGLFSKFFTLDIFYRDKLPCTISLLPYTTDLTIYFSFFARSRVKYIYTHSIYDSYVSDIKIVLRVPDLCVCTFSVWFEEQSLHKVGNFNLKLLIMIT